MRGKWCGFQSNDEEGNVVIHPVLVGSDSEFTPYTQDPADLVFPHNVLTYSTDSEAGPGRDGLIAYDASGTTQLVNGNGSPVTPGLTIGIK